jgi:hypothetical protein
MKLSRWQILLGLLLILISLSLYSAHYLIFGDAYHIWIYFLSNLAFLPIQIFFVTLLINQLMVDKDGTIKV